MSVRTRGRGANDAPVRNPLHAAIEVPVAPVAPEPLESDSLLGELVGMSGPAVPVGIELNDSDVPLPREFVSDPTRIHVVGLHGGAGTSSIASLLGQDIARDAGRTVPMGGRAAVLFVARTHGRGTAAVRAAGRLWAGGALADVTVAGVVLVDDAPRMSRSQQQDVKQVLRVLPHTWRLGWVEAWRTQQLADGGDLTVRMRRTVQELRAAARSLTVPAGTTTKEKS